MPLHVYAGTGLAGSSELYPARVLYEQHHLHRRRDRYRHRGVVVFRISLEAASSGLGRKDH